MLEKPNIVMIAAIATRFFDISFTSALKTRCQPVANDICVPKMSHLHIPVQADSLATFYVFKREAKK